MLTRAGFCALLYIASVSPLLADNDEVRPKFEVRTLSGKPIDRATVIVDFVEGRSYVKLGKKMLKHWEVRTNQEGLAKFPAIPMGKVRVQVTAKGYQTFGNFYNLDESDKPINIKLNPPQPQHSEHE